MAKSCSSSRALATFSAASRCPLLGEGMYPKIALAACLCTAGHTHSSAMALLASPHLVFPAQPPVSSSQRSMSLQSSALRGQQQAEADERRQNDPTGVHINYSTKFLL